MADTPTPQGPELAAAVAARDQLRDFLASAPEDLREWAEEQLATAEAEVTRLGAAAEEAPSAPEPSSAATDDAVGDDATTAAEPPVESRASHRKRRWANEDADDKYVDVEALAEGTPAEAPVTTTTSGAAPIAPAGKDPAARGSGVRTVLLAAAVVVIPCLIYFVYAQGRPAAMPTTMPSNHPQVTSTDAPIAATPTPVPAAKVAELEAAFKANPADVKPLRELGDLYMIAEQFDEAIATERRVLEVVPNDIDARLVIGVAYYAQGDNDNAEKVWLENLALDEKNAETHYNLGFLYMSKNPPEIEKTQQHWQKVIDYAPDSDMAETVSNHLDQLDSMTTTPVPSASPATPSATPSR